MAKKLEIKLFVDHSQAQQAADDAVKGLGKARDAAGKFAKGAEEAHKKNAEGFKQGSMLGQQFSDILGSVAGQFGLMNIAAKGLEYVNTQMELARDSARDAAKYVTNLRGTLQELAAMKGKLGDTGPEVLQNLRTRAKTLQTSDEVRQFQETMVGVGASAISNRMISQKDFDALGIKAGSFQAAEGGAASTHGQLAGMIPLLMGKQDTTADEAFRKEIQLYNIMSPGGATFSSGMNQLMKGAPLTTSGLFKDVADQAALLSAFSVTNREGAGENVNQFTRATVGSLGKMKNVNIEGDKQLLGAYLSQVGADTTMDPTQIGRLISADLSMQERADPNFNVMDYLKHHGYANQEDMLALMAFHGMNKTGQFDVFDKLAKTMPSTAEAEAQLKNFQAADPQGMKRRADVAESMAKFNVGAGPMEYYQQLQKNAFEELKGTPGSGVYGNVEDWANTTTLNNAMKRYLGTETKRLGIDVSQEQYNALGVGTEQDQAKRYYDIATQIADKGGNIMPGLDKLEAIMLKQFEEAQKLRVAFENSQKRAPLPLGKRMP